MIEISEARFMECLEKGTRPQVMDAVYMYSPLCGTCNLAERMLTIVMDSIPECRIFKLNVNDAPLAARKLMIQSIPCLLIWNRTQQEQEPARIYAMHSVTYLYEQIRGGLMND